MVVELFSPNIEVVNCQKIFQSYFKYFSFEEAKIIVVAIVIIVFTNWVELLIVYSNSALGLMAFN